MGVAGRARPNARLCLIPSTDPPLPQEDRDRLKSELASAGRTPEEADAEASEAMHERMAMLDEELQAKHSITQDQLMAAQSTYAEDSDVDELMGQLKMLIVGKEQCVAGVGGWGGG